jgi:hypothetical protein
LAVRQKEQMASAGTAPTGASCGCAGLWEDAGAGAATGKGAPQAEQNFFPGATSREQEGQVGTRSS